MWGKALIGLTGFVVGMVSATSEVEAEAQMTHSMYDINYRQVHERNPQTMAQVPHSMYDINYRQLHQGGGQAETRVRHTVYDINYRELHQQNNVRTEARVTHSMYDINYRQLVISNANTPPPVSSSGPEPVPTVAGIPSAPTASGPPTLIFSFASSSVPLAPTSPPITPAIMSTQSQISISALPPLSSSDLPHAASHPKKQLEADQKFKLIYLAPVFALLGILWGSLTAWFAYGCVTRRPKVVNDDSTIGGPRYVAAAEDLDQRRDVEEGHLRENKRQGAFCWPGEHEKVNGVLERVAEDDPFLVPPPSRPKTKSTYSSKTVVSACSDTTSMALLDMYESDGEDKEDVPWESLRHKSIKRGILEQVRKEGSWIDSLRGIAGSSFSKDSSFKGDGRGSAVRQEFAGKRLGHTRKDSDLQIQDVDFRVPDRVAPKVYSSQSESSGAQPTRPPLHADSTQSTIRTVLSRPADDTQWVKGGGFRIVEESPAPTPGEPPLSRSKFGSGWWWGLGADVDRYTPVPPRPSKSRSRSSSPVKGTHTPNNHQPHVGVLPQSPPQITSPPLESQLYFTPTPTSRARMGSSPGPVKRSRGNSRTTPTKCPDMDTRRKLKSPKVPPLPFPSNPDKGINSPRPDVYRARLAKPTSKEKYRPRASTGPSEHMAKVENTALKKVERIVQQSWSARDLGEAGVRSLSPTRFGKNI